MSVDIGTRGEPGADQFTIMVCTPSWLNNYLATRDEKHVFGRHYLIMQAWDYERLREVIHWRVQHTPGETWEEFASRLDLYLHWEFGQP